MDEIRNGKIELKPVKVAESGIILDASELNRSERSDLGEKIRLRLLKRKKILNRRDDSDEDN